MPLFQKDPVVETAAPSEEAAQPNLPFVGPELLGRPNLEPCTDCGNLISDEAEVCPHCGKRHRLSRTDQIATVMFIVFVAFVMFEFVRYTLLTPGKF
jgi:uncharacterized paraquat-inducible protein A